MALGRSVLLVLVIAGAFPGAARAACEVVTPGDGGGCTTTTSFSQFDTLSITQTITQQRTDAFVTRLIGRIQGLGTVFDQSFNQAIGALTSSGVAAARTAIYQAGGPALLTVLGPTRVASNQTVSTTATSIYTLASASASTITTTTIGPGTIPIGPRRICVVSAGPTNVAPSCTEAPVTYNLVGGQIHIDTTTGTSYSVTQSTTAVDTYTTSETWELVGLITPVGGVHAALMREAGLGGERFLKRLNAGPDGHPETPEGDGEGPGLRAWAESYGAWGSLDGSGLLAPGYDVDVYGVSLGLAGEIGDGLTLSGGFDWSEADADMALPGGFPESGTAALWQVGAALHRRWDGAEAGIAVTYGEADLSTRSGGPGFGGTAVSASALSVFGIEGRVGVPRKVWGGVLTPEFGVSYVSVNAEGLSESGSPFALNVGQSGRDTVRAFAGVAYDEHLPFVWDGVLRLHLAARVGHDLGDGGSVLAASFVSDPGTGLPIVLGAEDRTTGEVEAALSWDGEGISAHAGYTGRFSGGADIHAAKLGITLRW